MTTTTAVVALPADDWTEVADGAAFSQVTIQLRSVRGPSNPVIVQIFIGTAEPTTTDAVIELDPFVAPASPPISLAATDKVYAMADRAVKLGLIKVSV